MTAADPRSGTTPVVLAEPVRQRVVQLAADVLGALSADEVPASLRGIARFAPIKRVRLGAAALSAVLDGDEQFRNRVVDVVAETTPQLVDAVRSGAPTPASDPFDRAAVAYLVRPDGWEAIVTEAGARWQAERAERDAAASEIAGLRGQLTDLRAKLKEQDARLDEAVATATASLAAEVTHLRNTLRTRTGELRAATAALEDAQAALARAEAEQAGATAANSVELQRLRARISELERGGEAARRGQRTLREVEDTRLRLLLDTLADAAAGVRRELALPASALRPADLVAASDGAADADIEDVRDPAGLDRLLELPHVHVIVDGYNVTKTGYPELALADQRTRLISALAALQARSGAEVTVVFDGGARPPAQPRTPRGVRVLFSAPEEIADDLIRRLVAAEPAGRALVVVSTDQEIVHDVRRAGAWTVPSAVFLRRLS